MPLKVVTPTLVPTAEKLALTVPVEYRSDPAVAALSPETIVLINPIVAAPVFRAMPPPLSAVFSVSVLFSMSKVPVTLFRTMAPPKLLALLPEKVLF